MLQLSKPKTYEDENSKTANFTGKKAESNSVKDGICSPKRFVEVPLENFLRFAGFAKTENQENNFQMHFKNITRTHDGKNVHACGYYMSGSVMMKIKRNLLQKAEQRWMLLQLRISNVDEGTGKHDGSELKTRAKLRYKPLVNQNKKVHFLFLYCTHQHSCGIVT